MTRWSTLRPLQIEDLLLNLERDSSGFPRGSKKVGGFPVDQIWTVLVKQPEVVLSPTHLNSTQKEEAVTHHPRS